MNGDPVAARLDIGRPPSIASRIGGLHYEQSNATSKPAKTHREVYTITLAAFEPVYASPKELLEVQVVNFKRLLKSSGAPYTPGNLTFLN